ncbi:hypothetical protein B0T26DRAFT_642979 [Lasiosphaeria miniovina]|uniref:Uncharacterized protein n=1 Tax=Lasiosphaeria miniovina TaxID=1954250 RepID=A0AA40AV29_9PEZI|nr:uncharacterized protein B0T26DRAFT_642979 [Lasiosphaeria miniovina]KAK0722489.1 hypothetical protein B0T26DRAFT_642979 [Lasiosphaeria miniovina]
MSQHAPTFPAADDVDVDDVMSEESPSHQASPAKGAPATGPGSGKGKGRGRYPRTKTKAPKPPPPPKPTLGRGRRHKAYDSYKAQAAHERCQELKAAYSVLFKLVKPIVQEIADCSIAEILEDPATIERVPEFTTIRKFLSDRFQDCLVINHKELVYGLNMAEHVYEGEKSVAHDSHMRMVAELCEERYGQLLIQVDLLEHLYDNKLPVDLRERPQDAGYIRKDITQEQADSQSQYIEMRGGVEVPFPGTLLSELMSKAWQLAPEKATPKRKAEGQPEGQPNSKLAAAAAKDDDAAPELPRHSGGLLAAVEALEDGAATPGESGSPAPEPAEDPAPENADQPQGSGEATPKDGQEIPIPRGATGADEYGVRIISKRSSRLDIPNNRIMVPNTFEWEDHEIGFRDSTNCTQKGAQKAKRGKYIGKPNSNYIFLDRRVGTWDSTKAEGELEEELVKKHGLHPKLGLFLPTSTNEEEPPKPYEDGWRPVVMVSPNGERIHASRTIPLARLDRKVEEIENRAKIQRLLHTFCEQDGIAEDEIAPDPSLLEEYRKEELIARGIAPDEEEYRRGELVARGVDPDKVPAMSAKSLPRQGPVLIPDVALAFDEFADDILSAASMIEAEEGAARATSAKRSQPSRPYDAIRDVFTDSGASAPSTALPQVQQDVPAQVDITGLLSLAGAAYVAELSASSEPVRANDFLRTALNPQPTDYSPLPAPQDFPGDLMGSAQAQGSGAGRAPFSNPGMAKGLPALRPVRSLLNDTPPLPEPHSSPVPQHLNMVVSNSGAFFPPAPNRPFHNAFSVQEQAQGHPLHPIMQQPLSTPTQGPPLSGMPSAQARQISPYPMSPPLYHSAPPLVAPTPVLAPAPAAQAMPQLPNTPGQSASAASPRSRPGSSSASSSKYRKLEPAPTPPHRQGYLGNGQELRTVQFDYREAIKDYSAVEAPPRHGPTHIRGWTHNNLKKSRPSSKGDAPVDEPS